ncbi:MAG TPA: hypothetical protein VK907_12885, partial [Phnomibacter sp.]|nr:hypothetical protein [Phnomibacter sp.]
ALNKDGTGAYSLRIDMSGLLSDPMLKGMMEASEGDNKMQDADTTIFFRDLPDSVIQDNPDLWKRVNMRVVSRQKEEKLYTIIHLDFRSVDEIAYFSENFEKVSQKFQTSPMGGGELPNEKGPSGLFAEGLNYTLQGKQLTRETSTAPNKETDENFEMMKMFMGEATYRVKFTLPEKVERTTITNAVVDGNRVTVSASMVDLMDGKPLLDGSIWFK